MTGVMICKLVKIKRISAKKHKLTWLKMSSFFLFSLSAASPPIREKSRIRTKLATPIKPSEAGFLVISYTCQAIATVCIWLPVSEIKLLNK